MTTPSRQAVNVRLRALIWSCLDCDLLRTAVFYSEIYYCLDTENHDARHLFATALLRNGQTMSALHRVKDSRCIGCIEIYSNCCNKLGKNRKGKEALEAAFASGITSFAPDSPRPDRVTPDESVLRCRAGLLASKGNLPKDAISHLKRALEVNPFLWEAFEGLCALGSFPDVDQIIPARPPYNVRQPPETLPVDESFIHQSTPISGFFTPEANSSQHPRTGAWNQIQPFRLDGAGPRVSISTTDSSFYGDNSFYGRAGAPPKNDLLASTAAATNTRSRVLPTQDDGRPTLKRARGQITPARPRAAIPERTRTLAGSKVAPEPTPPIVKKPTSRTLNTDTSNLPTRRSSRLQGTTGKQPVKHTTSKRTAQPRAGSRHLGSDHDEEMVDNPQSPLGMAASPRSEFSPPPLSSTATMTGWELAEKAALDLADAYIIEIVRIFARAVRALARYESQVAIDELETLPLEQQRSPWVMTLIGRAEYEMVDYIKAERAFQQSRALDPFRIWDMEIYSTLLWHLHRDIPLSFLAQELVLVDNQSPQAWIAVGNCFSLQKEHAQALTCFRRAAQLDPNCAYAYTLSGHESVSTEEYEKAINFFRTAIKTDARHYNAWYGLGIVYLRTSKLRMAEYHFRKAVEINPNNAVLICCEGMVLEKRGATEEALGRYNRACELAPTSALVMFKRTKVLVALRRYELAVKDLLRLRDIAPDESNVAFMLGKVYRALGESAKATQQFVIAQELDPKLATNINQLLKGELEGSDGEVADETMDQSEVG